MKTTQPPRYSIAEIESALADSLGQTVLAARRLEELCRTNHTLNDMLAEARERPAHLSLVVGTQPAIDALIRGTKARPRKARKRANAHDGR